MGTYQLFDDRRFSWQSSWTQSFAEYGVPHLGIESRIHFVDPATFGGQSAITQMCCLGLAPGQSAHPEAAKNASFTV
jgi:hypothetical protein